MTTLDETTLLVAREVTHLPFLTDPLWSPMRPDRVLWRDDDEPDLPDDAELVAGVGRWNLTASSAVFVPAAQAQACWQHLVTQLGEGDGQMVQVLGQMTPRGLWLVELAVSLDPWLTESIYAWCQTTGQAHIEAGEAEAVGIVGFQPDRVWVVSDVRPWAEEHENPWPGMLLVLDAAADDGVVDSACVTALRAGMHHPWESRAIAVVGTFDEPLSTVQRHVCSLGAALTGVSNPLTTHVLVGRMDASHQAQLDDERHRRRWKVITFADLHQALADRAQALEAMEALLG